MPLTKDLIIDRDLSWLSFNKRLLEEAADNTLPLYERIKFLAIYSSNLDEFFRVRVASIRSLSGLGKKRIKKQLDFDPRNLLKEILKEVNVQLGTYGHILENSLLPQLEAKGIKLYYKGKLLKSHLREANAYFKSHILAYLQPHFFDSEKPLFLDNNGIYLIIELQNSKKPESPRYAHLKVPTDIPRFFSLSPIRGKYYIAMIDDIIRQNLDFIFEGHVVLNCYSVKLNRDQDMDLENIIPSEIIDEINRQLEKRKVGAPTRFLYDNAMPDHILAMLVRKLRLKSKDLVAGGRYHNMNDLMDLPNPMAPELTSEKLSAIALKNLDQSHFLFDAIDQKDVILHFPYQSYDYILRFFNEAAIDPEVVSIRATLYRIAADSLVGQSLITAAKNGKKVEVFVELKARFDEENNIRWAQKMVDAGVKVTYSLLNLKVHAKVALIKRRVEGKLKGYAYFGTGNFNENTAGVYADHGLLTCHSGMTNELNRVFDFLQEDEDIKRPFKHLFVAQFNLQERLVGLMDREIALAKEGKDARMIIKLNNLEEETMMAKLYEASQAGVKIDLIIRGICRLRPGIPGVSDNIRAIRIIDGFLEHARVFKFFNNGQPELYMASADWMNRNLHKRIEVGFPVYDEKAIEELNQMLELQLTDNTKARLLDADLNHHTIENRTKAIRSQTDFYQYLAKRERAQKV